MVNASYSDHIKYSKYHQPQPKNLEQGNNMSSAKFITLCFAFITIIAASLMPIISVISAMLCAGTGFCSINKGINNSTYLLSAVILMVMAGAMVSKIQ